MPLIECKQGEPEWLIARTGMVTASRMKDVVSKLKNGTPSQKRKDYMIEIVLELLNHRAAEHYVTPAMEFGLEWEATARASYEMHEGVEVEETGLWIHPQIKYCAASPDGLVGEEGLVEVKVPMPSTHLEYLIGGVVPEEYMPQMLCQMACTERQWCDFVSYHPDFPKEHKLFVRRFMRDDKLIEIMEQEVLLFLAEVDAMLTKINGLA